MNALAASPGQSVSFLAEKLEQPGSKRLAQLLTQLQSHSFQAREDAMRELKKLGDSAEPALRKLLQENPQPETRRRLKRLLDQMDKSDRLRRLRAIELLERIGDEAARKLLGRLAQGASGDWLGQEARQSLQRLR